MSGIRLGERGFGGYVEYFSAMDLATSIPSLRSSPTMRGVPQVRLVCHADPSGANQVTGTGKALQPGCSREEKMSRIGTSSNSREGQASVIDRFHYSLPRGEPPSRSVILLRRIICGGCDKPLRRWWSRDTYWRRICPRSQSKPPNATTCFRAG
jgi:hypothetical protein